MCFLLIFKLNVGKNVCLLIAVRKSESALRIWRAKPHHSRLRSAGPVPHLWLDSENSYTYERYSIGLHHSQRTGQALFG
jgi:myo-inositol-hexaphosphate 3-phosphohydrolase